MSRKTRNAAAFAAVLLAFASLFNTCSAAGQIDPLRYVPPDARGVVFVNARELGDMGALGSIASFSAELARNRGINVLEDFEKEKINIDKDIDAVVISITDGSWCAAAAGRFDPEAFYAWEKEKAAKRNINAEENYKGCRLIKDDEGNWSAVLDAKVTISSPDPALAKRLVDLHKGTTAPMAEDSPLLARMRNCKDQTIWFTMNPNQAGLPATEPAKKTSALSLFLGSIDPASIKSATAWSKITNEAVSLHSVIMYDGPESAAAAQTVLRSTVNVINGLFRTMADPDPAVNDAARDLASAIKIDVNGPKATVDATVKASLISTLGNAFTRWANRPRQ